MNVLVDTCVILDVFLKREPFIKDSYNFLIQSGDYHVQSYISTKQLADIHHLIKKTIHDERRTRDYLLYLQQFVTVIDTKVEDALLALESTIHDYEDALLAEIAMRNKVDYIVTRNIKDFKNASVPAILPEKFLKLLPDYSIQ